LWSFYSLPLLASPSFPGTGLATFSTPSISRRSGNVLPEASEQNANQTNKQKRKSRIHYLRNMTPSLNISSIRGILAVGQPTTVTEQRESESVRVTKPAINRISVWRVTSLFEAFAMVFVASYLLALVALSGALLFYTFNR